MLNHTVILLTLVALTPGARLPYIIRGHDAEVGRWPWQGSILYFDEHICGCALISDVYAITAAHCIYKQPTSWMTVGFGLRDVKTQQEGDPQISNIYYAIHNADYDSDLNKGLPNDIAIIKLETPIDFSRKYVDVIALPQEGANFENAECWVTGWGMTKENIYPNILQEARIGEMPLEDCKEKWSRSKQNTIREYHLCVGGNLEGPGSCVGDSGGPLSCKLGDTWYLAGVTSWSSMSCTVFLPSVYTRISHYRPWLRHMIDM